MFNSFKDSFTPGLEGLEFTITILVHGVINIMLLIYSLIYLTNDAKASVLKEMFVLKGILYPFIYTLYYILISVI